MSGNRSECPPTVGGGPVVASEASVDIGVGRRRSGLPRRRLRAEEDGRDGVGFCPRASRRVSAAIAASYSETVVDRNEVSLYDLWFPDDVPACSTAGVSRTNRRGDSFFRLLEFGVGKRPAWTRAATRRLWALGAGRVPSTAIRSLGSETWELSGKRRQTDSGSDIVGRPEKRPCNFRRIGSGGASAAASTAGGAFEMKFVRSESDSVSDMAACRCWLRPSRRRGRS